MISSGAGFDAAVCYAADNSRLKKALNKIHLGKLIYLLKALKMIFTMKMPSAQIRIDGQTEMHFDKVIFAAAMNTKYEGGGFMFAPDADPGDGYIDLLIAEGMPRLRILFILPTSFKGKHLKYKELHLIRCKKAEAHFSEEVCIHVDGEHFGFSKDVQFSLHLECINTISS